MGEEEKYWKAASWERPPSRHRRIYRIILKRICEKCAGNM
jgi:hypothetical protein